MTLREEINKSRQKVWREMDMEQIGGDLDTVIDRIDVIEARVFETDDLEKRIEKEVTTLQDQINRKLPKCE